jgi:hypothetical protein
MNRYYAIMLKRKGAFTNCSLFVLEFLKDLDCDPDDLAFEYLQEMKEIARESGIQGVFSLLEVTEKEADLLDETCAKNLDANPEYAELVGRFLDDIEGEFEEEVWTPEWN